MASGRPRPTHFIALRLVDDEVRRRMYEAQQRIIQANIPNFRSSVEVIVPTRFHLTFGAFFLDNELKSKMCECLDHSATDFNQNVPEGIFLHLKGVGQFSNNVVYADITEGASVIKVAQERVIQNLAANGIHEVNEVDRRAYVPHVTLMKGKYPHKIPGAVSGVTSSMGDLDFGKCQFVELQLCRMGPRGDYYRVEHNARFTSK